MGINVNNFLVSILAAFFKPVAVPKELYALESSLNSTILVTQSNSLIFKALLLSLGQKLGIQSEHQLDSHSLENIISKKQSSILPMSWISIHDIENSEINAEITESAINLVSFNVFQVKGPIRKWPSFRPSILWQWGLIPTRRILTITIGEKISLNQPSRQRLVRLLKIDFIRTLKLVRGSPIEPREEQLKSITSTTDYERELRIISERSGLTIDQGRSAAKKAFYELSANPRRIMYDALGLICKILLKRLFSEVRTNGLDKLIPAIKDNTVVLVPMHRSHLDYILVGTQLYSEKVNPPYVAAGINLSFWPFGFLFRSVGAYFVKRNARDRFHSTVLKRYISYLVRKGHLQEFFIEGGRSRSGKMLEPKLGILSTIVEAAKNNRNKDILFVPVAITYENIIEDEAYGKENSGASKVKETFLTTLKALDIFKRRYGEAIIEFARPISLKTYKANNNNISEKNLIHQLGYEICRGIRNQTNPGLTSLAYSAVLMTGHYGLKQAELKNRICQMHRTLEILKSCGFKIGSYTTQLEYFISGNDEVLTELSAASVLKSEEHFGERYFFIPGNIRYTADYYRNSIIHYFFPISLLALSELTWGSVDLEKTEILFKLFKEDLLLQSWDLYKPRLEVLCKGLCERQLMNWESEDKYSFSSRDIFFPAMLASYLQAYMWVIKSLTLSDHNDLKSDGKLLTSRLITKLSGAAKAESYVGNITRTEATSKSTLNSILNSLSSRGLISISEGKQNERAITLNENSENTLKADLEILSKVNYRLNLYLLNQERD